MVSRGPGARPFREVLAGLNAMHHHQISKGSKESGMICVGIFTPGLGPYLGTVVVRNAPGCMLIPCFLFQPVPFMKTYS